MRRGRDHPELSEHPAARWIWEHLAFLDEIDIGRISADSKGRIAVSIGLRFPARRSKPRMAKATYWVRITNVDAEQIADLVNFNGGTRSYDPQQVKDWFEEILEDEAKA